METQTWRGLGVEVRRPGFTDVTVSGCLFFLLHIQPDVPELAAVGIGFIALRCIRYRPRTTRSRILE